jgi:hypothetical protein
VHKAFAELLKDERVIALSNYVPSLGLFRAIGVERDLARAFPLRYHPTREAYDVPLRTLSGSAAPGRSDGAELALERGQLGPNGAAKKTPVFYCQTGAAGSRARRNLNESYWV